jgi:hypothetical protein
MRKGYFRVLVGAALLWFSAGSHAALVTVDALANSSTGGVGKDTGLVLALGQLFSVSVDPLDLWNAGALPRWSNADGLTGNLFATGSDESGQPGGTLIGQNFGLHSQDGLSAPFGTLVGRIGAGAYFVIGTSFTGPANAAGTLFLFYWDSINSDNTEFITADVQAVPVPAAIWLLGSALLGVSLVARRRVK